MILNQWDQLKELDEYTPLYDRYKKYFGYLNTGFKGKQFDVFAYNGGLFKPDEILDSISINDELLYKHTLKLSRYDFASEIDVNILGHIFENSLNELDEVKAQLEGNAIDKTKTRRKKDGVFYTPKYITKYIVDNTIGKLCIEKREELTIVDEDYFTDKKRQKKTTKSLVDKLSEYRNWLLQLTICDPACGSGAFLNQALDFLITEHKYVDELQAKLFGDAMVMSDVENSILENNLFGVDLNEESVEIAKLSLWLRTAQPNRKLNDLNNNIKCGNSLIEDVEIVGDKAFNWEVAFPKVFEKGGFDVVIGNPPYVTRGITDRMKEFLNSNFETAQYQLDLYVSFMERGIGICKESGYLSYIVPNSWLKNMMMSGCRKFILDNLSLSFIIPSLENVFPEASVDTMIFIGSKVNNGLEGGIHIGEFINKEINIKHQVIPNRFLNNKGHVFDVEINDAILPIVTRMNSDVIPISDLFDVIRGINPYDKYTGQSAEIISSRAYHANFKKDDTFVPELKGMHITRYGYKWDNKHYISYGDWLAAPRHIKHFEGPRIVFREILGKTLVSTLIEEDFKIDRSLYIAKLQSSMKEKFSITYVLSILNSKLMAFYFRFTNNEFDTLFPKIRVAEFKNLPIKNIAIHFQTPLIEKSNSLLLLIKELQDDSSRFQRTLQRKFELEILPKKLQDWYLLSYTEFIKELGKKKVKLSLSQEAEWEDYFIEESKKALELKATIDVTDKAIDKMVYELYGLSEEEIGIVEKS
jgi:type I restriction-modification system DNA methylase subunit